jgi:hypothetical protein
VKGEEVAEQEAEFVNRPFGFCHHPPVLKKLFFGKDPAYRMGISHINDK